MTLLVPDRSCLWGGIERVCLSLFPELGHLGVRMVWAIPSFRIRALSCAESVNVVPIEWPDFNWRRSLSVLGRGFGATRLVDGLYLARVRHLQREWRADHLLYPWLRGQPIPDDDGVPCTVLVLDRNWTKFPDSFEQKPEELDAQLEAWMLRAKNVVAISRNVAEELALRWPAVAPKIVAIPLAASARLERPAESSPVPSFYYPATVAPHKGHGVLLAAARLLSARGLGFRIIMSGHGTDGLAAKAEVADAVLFQSGTVTGIGYADMATVEKNYLQATAVVLPSFYEGFGLPLAEALAHGTPVICNDLPTFREQIERLGAADHSRIVPIGDAPALAEAMAARIAVGAPSWPERLSISRLADRWTWRDVAKAYQTLLTPDHYDKPIAQASSLQRHSCGGPPSVPGSSFAKDN